MKINLLDFWENGLSMKAHEVIRGNIDDEYAQSSFEFEKPLSVVFIKSRDCFEPVIKYDDLPEIPLNAEEKQVVDARIKELNESSNPHDGNHLLIASVIFDDEKNIIYLEAKKAKYSLLSVLSRRKLPENSHLYNMSLYEIGTLIPFITNDDYMYLMERNDYHHLYCTAAGYVQPVGEDNIVDTTKTNGHDLIVATAIKETLEEFLGANGTTETSRINFLTPTITSLIIHKKNNGVGSIEFIAPMKLDCRHEELEYILRHNEAVDSHEHTGKFYPIALRSSERNETESFLKMRKPGSFLYEPMLMSASRIVNNNGFMPLRFPLSDTQAIPIKIFSQKPERPLLTWNRKIQSDAIRNNLKIINSEFSEKERNLFQAKDFKPKN